MQDSVPNAVRLPTPDPSRPPPAPASAPAAGQNTLMWVLSYLSILRLIPLFTAKGDPFVRFHTGQGLTLFLAEVLVSILSNILWRVFPYGLLWRAAGYLYGILGLIFLVLGVTGIVHAVQGFQKPLPVLGASYRSVNSLQKGRPCMKKRPGTLLFTLFRLLFLLPAAAAANFRSAIWPGPV